METLKNVHSWKQIVGYWLPGAKGDSGDRNQERLVKGGENSMALINF